MLDMWEALSKCYLFDHYCPIQNSPLPTASTATSQGQATAISCLNDHNSLLPGLPALAFVTFAQSLLPELEGSFTFSLLKE